MRERPTARRPVSAGPGRRTRPVRRASRRITPVRVASALIVVLAVSAIYGVVTTSAFTYAQLRVDGASYTKSADVASALDGVRGRNLFTIQTEPLRANLEALSTVARARIDVELPDTLAVTLDERTPILVWKVGDRRFLVASDGTLFAMLPSDPPAAAAALPVVEDRRSNSSALDVGFTLDPVDLDAATRLGSLVPSDIGSAAGALAVTLTDENGYVIKPSPGAWSAIFGFYTPTLRTPELIPGQVRLLRSLLIGREPLLDRVILANATDGTYTVQSTPQPLPTPAPSAAP